MRVRKVVITAAGWGTRFLPITKSQPKEMLPLVDKPLIQCSVEEAIGSGIEQVIFVTSMGKRSLEDYFDRSLELEHFLEKKGDVNLLAQIRKISNMVNVCYIRQKEQLGLGHAILTTRDVVGEEPFAVILPDDIIDSEVPTLKDMIDVYEKYKSSVVAVERVSREEVKNYGVIKPEKISNRINRVLGMTEKPEPDQAPSNLGVVGRYILTPEIFDMLEVTPPGKNQEIQLTDALNLLLDKQSVYAYEFPGNRYDTGTPLGWLKATFSYALKNPDMEQELRKYLRGII